MTQAVQAVLESIWFKQSLSPDAQEILRGCSCQINKESQEISLVTNSPKVITRNFNKLDQELRFLGLKKVLIFKVDESGKNLYCSLSLGLFQNSDAPVLA